MIITLVEIGVVVGSSARSTLVFDGPHRALHLRQSMFLFETEVNDFPLEQVRGAVVVTSDQADALCVVLSDGSRWQMSAYNQMGGKD